MIRNRKGNFMGENALGIILAAFGIVLLSGVIYVLWNAAANSESANAKNLANSIEAKINFLKDGQTGNFLIQSPCTKSGDCKWYLRGWNADMEGKPEKCSIMNSCFCICNGLLKSDQDSCYCRNFNSKNLYVFTSATTFSEQEVLQKIIDLKGYYSQFGCLKLASLIELNVTKSRDTIKISNPSKEALCASSSYYNLK